MWIQPSPELSKEQLADAAMKSATSGPLPLRDHKGRYLHWDDLRHREIPPEHLSEYPSHAEYWAGMKIARTASARRLPFRDTKGVPFWYCSSAVEQLGLTVDRKAGGIAMETPRQAQSDHAHRHAEDGLIREAICSSQHEGATTPYDTAKEMLVMRRAPSDKSERMIHNNCRAMRFVISERRSLLTVDLIREIHKIVTEGTLDRPEDEGRIRGGPEGDRNFRVAYGERTVHVPPPSGELERRLELLCEFANAADEEGEFIHDCIRAMILHFAFAYDHPFLDGNGRTARILYYWVMEGRGPRVPEGGGYALARHASISSVILRGTRDYARSYLLSESDGGDVTYFLDHHARLTLRVLQELDEKMTDCQKEHKRLAERLRRCGTAGDWNHRQLSLLAHALGVPETSYVAAYHARRNSITKPTSLSDLDQLAAAGLLTKSRRGRKHLYRAATNLRDILRPGCGAAA